MAFLVRTAEGNFSMESTGLKKIFLKIGF